MTKLTNQQFQAKNLANHKWRNLPTNNFKRPTWPASWSLQVSDPSMEPIQSGLTLVEQNIKSHAEFSLIVWIFQNDLLSSLRAESARAVTGRRCPYSGEGEDFVARWPFFYECGPNTGTKSRKMTFWPNIGPFGPFGSITDQKTMRTRCLDGFPLRGYQNFCFLP